jgi:single-stranded-DNA-specific exonuclease
MNTHFDIEALHPITKTLLEKRGITNPAEVEEFLTPSYEKHIGDPFQIYGMEKAVNRITDAMRNGEKTAIYSDYDCDGVPGGVLLRTFFDDIGYPVEMYIPHRHNEGYGVHKHAIDALKKKGVTLIITVDSGITNIEEVEYAKGVGVDFIITDHHLPITKENIESRDASTEESQQLKTNNQKLSQVVPDAVAVLNSKQDACTYWDDMLCGCAVAWKLACAVLMRAKNDISLGGVHATVKELPEGYEKWLLDLVGISTIADMVPLRKENRALAHFGLKVLRKTKRHGLNHIFNEQRMRKDVLTEEDIAFTIAPRVNAASRMGDPMQAHMMLYEKDRESAEGYAFELEELNTQRKSEVKDIVSTISFDHDVYKDDVVVVGDVSWGPGVLGLIAQKIIDETGKPVFVWGSGENKEELKGSCRSLGDVSVVDMMAHVGHEVLLGWGGHEGAGGFSLLPSHVESLRKALNESYHHVERRNIAQQAQEPDMMLTLEEVNDVTYNALSALAPFGEGNPKPLFSFDGVEAFATKWFGKKGEHFEVVYGTKDGKKIKAIQFFAPKDLEDKMSRPHTLHAHIEKSYFGGKVELRLRVAGVE